MGRREESLGSKLRPGRREKKSEIYHKWDDKEKNTSNVRCAVQRRSRGGATTRQQLQEAISRTKQPRLDAHDTTLRLKAHIGVVVFEDRGLWEGDFRGPVFPAIVFLEIIISSELHDVEDPCCPVGAVVFKGSRPFESVEKSQHSVAMQEGEETGSQVRLLPTVKMYNIVGARAKTFSTACLSQAVVRNSQRVGSRGKIRGTSGERAACIGEVWLRGVLRF